MSRTTEALLRCERCNELLDPEKAVWLELDVRENKYTDMPIPEEDSQGGFPFGKACAKKALGQSPFMVDHRHRRDRK
jgi:hypothetical protein